MLNTGQISELEPLTFLSTYVEGLGLAPDMVGQAKFMLCFMLWSCFVVQSGKFNHSLTYIQTASALHLPSKSRHPGD